jgi:DNA polymerase-3 subunit beta
MELVVRKSDLLRELQLFQGIVERNTTIPVLGNVLMEADGDELRFLATDLQVALRSSDLVRILRNVLSSALA